MAATARRAPRTPARPRRAHELVEIRKLAEAQERSSDRAALLLMGRLGLRKMEVARLQARDVDLANDLVYIEKAKGGGRHVLPIAYPDVRASLTDWLSESGPDEYAVARRRSTEGGSEPLDPSSVHRWFKRCLRRAWLRDFPMHELRHSAADRLWRTTGDMMSASQLLRHSNPATTARYLHPSRDDLRERMRASDAA